METCRAMTIFIASVFYNSEYTQQFYIRVFDPDTEANMMKSRGNLIQGALFIYGGKGVDPDRNEESKDCWTA